MSAAGTAVAGRRLRTSLAQLKWTEAFLFQLGFTPCCTTQWCSDVQSVLDERLYYVLSWRSRLLQQTVVLDLASRAFCLHTPHLLCSIARSISLTHARSGLGALQQFSAINTNWTFSSQAPAKTVWVTCDGEQQERPRGHLASFNHGDTTCRHPFQKPSRSLKRHTMSSHKGERRRGAQVARQGRAGADLAVGARLGGGQFSHVWRNAMVSAFEPK